MFGLWLEEEVRVADEFPISVIDSDHVRVESLPYES